jgi:hypothetical protein
MRMNQSKTKDEIVLTLDWLVKSSRPSFCVRSQFVYFLSRFQIDIRKQLSVFISEQFTWEENVDRPL